MSRVPYHALFDGDKVGTRELPRPSSSLSSLLPAVCRLTFRSPSTHLSFAKYPLVILPVWENRILAKVCYFRVLVKFDSRHS